MYNHIIYHASQNMTRGGGNDLAKFKFSVGFPIGLHVILQLQIKKSIS